MKTKLLKNKHNQYLLNSSLENIAEAVNTNNINYLHETWQSSLKRCLPFETPAKTVSGQLPLNPEAKDFPLIISSSCSSTLDLARYMCEKEVLDNWGSLIAFEQYAGRGQMGRKWYSSVGNLFATLILPELPGKIARLVPLIAGVSLSELLESEGLVAGIKRPNDLIVNQGKVAGILVENREGHIWLGLGVNLVHAPEEDLMRMQGAFKAASLKDFGVSVDILAFWSDFVAAVYHKIQNLLKSEDIASLVKEIEKRLLFLGQSIKVSKPANKTDSFYGTLLGLEPDGALKIQKGNEIVTLYSAEILPG